MFHKQNGNALLYILIAVMLLAVLTYTIMGEQRGQQQNQLSESRIKLLATDLISHANSAEIAVKQMTQWGLDYSDLDNPLPGTSNYGTNPSQQIYHPSGGGLQVFNQDNLNLFDSVGERGWRWQYDTNVEWTSTTATDVIYSFVDLNGEICAEINKQLYNDSSIPATIINFGYLFAVSGTNADFLIADCPECEGKKAMCIASGADNYTFYNIIGSR